MAESENVYVKIGERGLLIERTANTPRDHVNLRGTGWKLKGSKGAPTKKDETPPEPVEIVPAATSVRAYADEVDADTHGDKKTRVATGAGSSRTAKSQTDS